jgi:ribosome-associated protein
LRQESLERARRIWIEADRRKALDPVVLDVGKLTIICDYFIVCGGRSLTHIEALAEGVVDGAEEHGIRVARKTRVRDAKWVVLDFGDVVVHILAAEARAHYDLEGLWAQAETICFEEEPAEEARAVEPSEG